MKQLLSLFLLCLSFTLLQCSGSKKIKDSVETSVSKQGVDFVRSKTLTKVLEDAQADGKIVFLDMYTTWCAPCKVMDEEVYTDASVEALLDEQMISYKVDAEKGNGPDLTVIYNVQVYPTLIFLDDKGRELARNDGALSTTGFLELARQALAARDL